MLTINLGSQIIKWIKTAHHVVLIEVCRSLADWREDIRVVLLIHGGLLRAKHILCSLLSAFSLILFFKIALV